MPLAKLIGINFYHFMLWEQITSWQQGLNEETRKP